MFTARKRPASYRTLSSLHAQEVCSNLTCICKSLDMGRGASAPAQALEARLQGLGLIRKPHDLKHRLQAKNPLFALPRAPSRLKTSGLGFFLRPKIS